MPTTLPAIDTLTHAVALASRAPSLHNSQPWRWRYGRTGLDLFADTSRLIPSTDPSGRELMLSCGAVLDHLRAAMASMGWQSLVERFPNPNNSQHLARLNFKTSDFITQAERARAKAMTHRRTDRLPFAEPIGWTMFETVLRPLLGEDVDMTVVSEAHMPEIQRASELADSMRRYDSQYHSSMDIWTGHSATNDGVPTEALPTLEESQRVPAGREFPTHEGADRRPEVGRDFAKIVVLSTENDHLRDALRCGEALSTVLLEATVSGFATCPLTHVVELPISRYIVQNIVGRGLRPQILVRIGTSTDQGITPQPTNRRAVSEILEIME